MNTEAEIEKLKVITDNHTKVIEDHEGRIRNQEQLASTVVILSNTVDRLSDSVKDFSSMSKSLETTLDKINKRVLETELKQQYSTYIKIKAILKQINWKKIIIYVLGGACAGTIVNTIINLIG